MRLIPRNWTILIVVTVLSGLLLTACGNEEREANRALAEEVMAIHDQAMAKMTRMHELRLQLQAIVPTVERSTAIAEALRDLQEANRAMMNWMHDYNHPGNDDALNGAGDYLRDEREKIKRISEAIDTAISRAEALVTA